MPLSGPKNLHFNGNFGKIGQIAGRRPIRGWSLLGKYWNLKKVWVSEHDLTTNMRLKNTVLAFGSLVWFSYCYSFGVTSTYRLGRFTDQSNYEHFGDRKTGINKKVLLRECKRHATHCVASAHYAGGGWGGTPSSHGGGYPIQSWWGGTPPSHGGDGGTRSSHGGGYPIQSWCWVPNLVMVGGTPSSHGGGTPSSHGRGYLIQSWSGVTHPVILGGTQVPRYPPHPPSRPGWGTPTHHPDLAGVPPHHPDLAGVPPPTIQTWLGYPPPSVEVWTDKQILKKMNKISTKTN